jgi:uncharacterized protein YciI
MATQYVVFYEGAEGGRERVPEFYPAHRARGDAFHDEGRLLFFGPFMDAGTFSAMAIFASRDDAEAFVAGDPFVTNELVARWEIREWREAYS